jgi:hypothetical protein
MVELFLYIAGFHVNAHHVLKLCYKLEIRGFRLAGNKALYDVKDRRHHLLQGISNLAAMVITIVSVILIKLLVNGKSPAMVLLNATIIECFGRASVGPSARGRYFGGFWLVWVSREPPVPL